jgi:hypothetical protein
METRMNCDNCDCAENKTCHITLQTVNPLDLLPVSPTPPIDIGLPHFPTKINVNTTDELPPLHKLSCDSQPKILTLEEKSKIMNDIEKTVNFSNADEGIQAFNNPEVIFNRIEDAFTTFKEQTGRNMTYSEMRYMMG